MWYVIQTLGGEEEYTADMIRKRIPPNYMEECFVPKRERIKKFRGQWNKVEETLFPAYIFVVTDRPEELYQELRYVPKLTKVLGREGQNFYPLNEEEERLVRDIGGLNHWAPVSRIEIGEGKEIRVVDGPLKDYVEDVVKVNLHKREALIRVRFMGREMELKLGVEMVKENGEHEGNHGGD
ncbi:MAG: antiterminator LoaP [Lachnospiraceae bacterium]|nr:antiterminator LoaP [Lachnospiraceae bacterium]